MKVLSLLLGLFVAACAFLPPTPHGPTMPADLIAASTEEEMSQQMASEGGCAFAGTWHLQPYGPAAYGYAYGWHAEGYLVVEVVGNRLRAARQDRVSVGGYLKGFERPYSETWFIEATIAPGGLKASGTAVCSQPFGRCFSPHLGHTSLDIELGLDPNGPNGGLLIETREAGVLREYATLERIKTLPCNRPIPFVQQVTDWAIGLSSGAP